MNTLRDDGARKVIAGMTTVEEVLAATQDDVEDEVATPGTAAGKGTAAAGAAVGSAP